MFEQVLIATERGAVNQPLPPDSFRGSDERVLDRAIYFKDPSRPISLWTEENRRSVIKVEDVLGGKFFRFYGSEMQLGRTFFHIILIAK